MDKELTQFAGRLRERVSDAHSAFGNGEFIRLALELFALQFARNGAYAKFCAARGRTPAAVEDWSQLPFVPAGAFKELQLSCIPPEERTAVFHSSGTTEQKPSRHFHCAESLALYEASLWSWFARNLRLTICDLRLPSNSRMTTASAIGSRHSAIILTPPPEQAPHSSLVHMFETIRRELGAPESAFVGLTDVPGAWTWDFDAAFAALDGGPKFKTQNPKLILGTAFSFVHLLDRLVERNLFFQLPPGSRVMETGGYKNRSRVVPKSELHALITERLGVPPENIVCEYGMSELSSQAYDVEIQPPAASRQPRVFRFPPWARGQIISPETGREAADGETGLIRVFDLANVFSVAAIQTEDLGVRRAGGFDLVGRAQFSEPRGCSLMTM